MNAMEIWTKVRREFVGAGGNIGVCPAVAEEAAAAVISAHLPGECPSCHGLNTSCPDGCGRDPETGELNGTRLHLLGDDVGRVANAVIHFNTIIAPFGMESPELLIDRRVWARQVARAAIAAMPKVDGWRDIASAPHACHVLAARFDGDTGNWAMQVVLGPPSYPFTHWMPLPPEPTNV